jgi:hypothetical protein
MTSSGNMYLLFFYNLIFFLIIHMCIQGLGHFSPLLRASSR